MGDVEKTVEILFQGRDDTSSAITSIQNSLDSLETTANDIGGGLEDLGAPFQTAAESVAILETAILGIAAAGLTARENIESEANKMSDALGLPSEAAEEFEEVAKRVYSSGFGGDLEESFSAVTLAAQKFSGETSVGIEEIVTNAAKLNYTFGTEYAESITTVKSLTDNFGISSESAFDLITAGLQEGLNSSGDFFDSIKEYGPLFEDAGADAGQMFSILSSGFAEGIGGTDAAADAFKEFSDKILTNSSATQEALEAIGIDPDELNKNLASGETTVAEAFTNIVNSIGEAEDKTTAFTSGAELMGEPFSKLGVDGATSISSISTSLDDLTGKIDDIDPAENLSVKFESMMKTITTTLVSDDVWGGVETSLGEIFDGFKDNFVEAWGNIDDSDLQPLLDSFEDLFGSIQDLFADAGFDLSSVEGIEEAIQKVIDSVTSINNISTGFVEAIEPITTAISELIDWFNDLDPETQELSGNILAVGTALGAVGTALATGGAVLGGMSKLANMLAPGGSLSAGAVNAINQVGLLSQALSPFATMAAIAISFKVGWEIGGVIRDTFDIDEIIQEGLREVDKVINFTGTAGDITFEWEEDEIEEKLNSFLTGLDTEALEILFNTETEPLESAKELLDSIPPETQAELLALVESGDMDALAGKIEALQSSENEVEIKVVLTDKEKVDTALGDFFDDIDGYQKNLEIVADISGDGDLSTFKDELSNLNTDVTINVETEQATETLTYWTEENGTVEVEVPVTTSGADEAKKAIEDIPTEKQIEITLQGDIDKEIAQIEASAQTAEAAFKYTAEVDISQIEADAEVATAAFESIGESVSAMSSSVEGMFGSLTSAFSDENMSRFDQWELQRMVEDQQEAQNKLIDAQVELAEAQTEYMNQKTQSMQDGDAMITIDSSGLEPALEMIMWEIIEKVQIRANESSSDFLLGF